jgi:hypothetical protein
MQSRLTWLRLTSINLLICVHEGNRLVSQVRWSHSTGDTMSITATSMPKFEDTRVLLTLFTTFRHSIDTQRIHLKTIVNWAFLQPLGVRLVLYADVTAGNESTLLAKARSRGWKIRQSPATSKSEVPVLRHMFLDAESSSRSVRIKCFEMLCIVIIPELRI